MTDGLFDMTLVSSSIGGIVSKFGPYLIACVGVYLGLFVLGLVWEALSGRGLSRADDS